MLRKSLTTSTKLFVGHLLVNMFPNKANRLKESGMTMLIEDNLSRSERIMRDAILSQVEQGEKYTELSELHRNYWVNRGDEYFDYTDNDFELVFLPDCAFIFDLLHYKLGRHHQYKRMVEIGTGNGDVLMYLASRFPSIKEFYGIDLSSKQTAANKKRLTRYPVEFVAADGFDWVFEHGIPHTIYVTSRGVLEYFTQERLLAFFRAIKQKGPAIFIAIEPNDLEMNYQADLDSRPYGIERSFSHNYEVLFEKAGFSIEHFSSKAYELHDHKLVFIIAES